jgi:hypothetical protein
VVPDDKVVVESKVIPPLDGVAQLGTPAATVRTVPVPPMPSLVLTLDVDERKEMSPRVVSGFI